MTDLPGPVGDDELMAYVDGRLSPDRAEAVGLYLAAHPEIRERLSQYADQRQALLAAFGERGAGPIPTRLRLTRLLAERRRRRRRRFAEIAAAICLVALGGAGGWTARDLMFPQASPASALAAGTIMADALAAHRTFAVEVRHPVEVDAAQEAHLVQWLSKRLGRPLVVPDLSATGYRLMGGRLLPAGSGPAAQLMYENAAADRLTVYVRPGVAGEASSYQHDKNVGAFYRADEGLGCVIVGDADRGSLSRAAERVYEQTFPGIPKRDLVPQRGKNG
jgi:anti-sigma factor RsiW